MKKHLLSVLLTLGLAAAVHAAEPKKVLVVTVTTGFRHSSIATAEKVIAKIGADSGAFTVDFVQQPGAGAPRKPSLPKKPADLGTDANDAAKNKYAAEMKKFAAAEIKCPGRPGKIHGRRGEIQGAPGRRGSDDGDRDGEAFLGQPEEL